MKFATQRFCEFPINLIVLASNQSIKIEPETASLIEDKIRRGVPDLIIACDMVQT